MNAQARALYDRGERAFRVKRMSPDGDVKTLKEVASSDELKQAITDFAVDTEMGRYVGPWKLVIELWDEHSGLV